MGREITIPGYRGKLSPQRVDEDDVELSRLYLEDGTSVSDVIAMMMKNTSSLLVAAAIVQAAERRIKVERR